jgi:hypothetical protein
MWKGAGTGPRDTKTETPAWLSGCGDGEFIVYCEIVAEVLGRVVQVDLDSPRGPDASHRIKVPRDWIIEGSIIELELPRHLTCRTCEGGGCDACERSGAVTLRGRGEPPDLVEVTLPARPENDSFVIRIPEHGGLAGKESGLPRGQLFLRIEASEGSDPSASVNKIIPVAVAARRALDRAEAPKRDLAWLFPAGIALAVFLGILVWYFVLSR